jgi:hypothetical protein
MPTPAGSEQARRQVLDYVEQLLPGAVDEVTGNALDRFIASRTAGLLAQLDTEHADRSAVVARLIGAARERVAATAAVHDHDHRALHQARSDHDAARARLAGHPTDTTGSHR